MRQLARQLALFPAQTAITMIHRGDPVTSRHAAVGLLPRLGSIHARVLDAFRRLGPMHDERLENSPEFAKYAPSTIRKRRSELYHAGRLVQRGVERNSRGHRMVIWGEP